MANISQIVGNWGFNQLPREIVGVEVGYVYNVYSVHIARFIHQSNVNYYSKYCIFAIFVNHS